MAFVGRQAQRDAFLGALDGRPFGGRRIFLIQAGRGMGKTALLRELERMSVQAGLEATRIDACRDTRVDGQLPEDLGAAAAVRLPLSPAPPRGSSQPTGPAGVRVLLLDNVDEFQDRLLDRILPLLPVTTVVAMTMTAAPSGRWTVDPGWRDLVRMLSLPPLSPDESSALLRHLGVSPGEYQRLADRAGGHPQSLAQLASSHGEAVPAGDEDPQLIYQRLQALIGEVPDQSCLEALFVCAHGGVVSAEFLKHVLDPVDVTRVWAWLTSLGVARRGSTGMTLTPYARHLVEVHVRLTMPDRWNRLHRAVHGFEPADTAADHVIGVPELSASRCLLTGHPGSPLSAAWERRELGSVRLERALPAHQEATSALFRTTLDAREAELAAQWAYASTRGLYVAEETHGLRGAALVVSHTYGDPLPVKDPKVEAVLRGADDCAALRPGEPISILRFAVGTNIPETAVFCGVSACIDDWLRRRPSLAVVVPPVPLVAWHEILTSLAMASVPWPDSRDGVEGFYLLDFRRIAPSTWLDLLLDRNLDLRRGLPPEVLLPKPLNRPEFADAVKSAFRDLKHSAGFGQNPLLKCSLVSGAGRPPDEALRRLLVTACRSLGSGEKERNLSRVLELAFLDGVALNQAAKTLSLSLSTFRRYLDEGVDRVTSTLWMSEVGVIQP